MLHQGKIVSSTLKRCRKLPRLAMLGMFPLMISVIIPMPISLAFALQSWSIFFLGMFWLEGLYLSLQIIDEIGERGKIYNLLAHLYDMEFDRDATEQAQE